MVGESGEDAKDYFPMVCRPTQCLFCLGDDRLPYLHRIFEYAKPNRMRMRMRWGSIWRASPRRIRSPVRIHSARQQDWSCLV